VVVGDSGSYPATGHTTVMTAEAVNCVVSPADVQLTLIFTGGTPGVVVATDTLGEVPPENVCAAVIWSTLSRPNAPWNVTVNGLSGPGPPVTVR
jgi:hypothetical protein